MCARLFTKGAAEMVLELCTQQVRLDVLGTVAVEHRHRCLPCLGC